MSESYNPRAPGNIKTEIIPSKTHGKVEISRTEEAGDPRVTGFFTDDAAFDSITRKRVGLSSDRLRACRPPPGASRYRSPVTCLFRVSRGLDTPPGPKPKLPVLASGASRLPGSVPPASRRDHSHGVNWFFKV
jgi:hypothetical protein